MVKRTCYDERFQSAKRSQLSNQNERDILVKAQVIIRYSFLLVPVLPYFPPILRKRLRYWYRVPDYRIYAANVNRHRENFLLSKRTADNFKCLIFVNGLKSPRTKSF